MSPTIDTEPRITQPTFQHRAYGVDLSWFGDEGGMAAFGHVPRRRFIAACNWLARNEAGLRNIGDDPLMTLASALSAVRHVWALPVESSEYEWEVRWAGHITEHTPGAMAMTVLWL